MRIERQHPQRKCTNLLQRLFSWTLDLSLYSLSLTPTFLLKHVLVFRFSCLRHPQFDTWATLCWLQYWLGCSWSIWRCSQSWTWLAGHCIRFEICVKAGIPVSLESNSSLHTSTNIHHITASIHLSLHVFRKLLTHSVQSMHTGSQRNWD